MSGRWTAGKGGTIWKFFTFGCLGTGTYLCFPLVRLQFAKSRLREGLVCASPITKYLGMWSRQGANIEHKTFVTSLFIPRLSLDSIENIYHFWGANYLKVRWDLFFRYVSRETIFLQNCIKKGVTPTFVGNPRQFFFLGIFNVR